MVQGLDTRAISIYSPILEELSLVEDRLQDLANTSIPELEPLLDHALSHGGKRVRPALTLLAASIIPTEMDNPVKMATGVELLHLATLIHDDTVDDADTRRGRASVSGRWGKEVAVLLGDYLFATSATLVCDTGNLRVVRRFAETIMELASGELIEYFNTFNPQQEMERYYDRIYRKTASLFRTASETGAVLSGADEDQIQALSRYGYNIGMAFQVVDDLLDILGDESELGKPVGNDLKQGILTLPTILLLQRYPENNPIPLLFKEPGNTCYLERALEMTRNSSIIPDCFAVIREYCDKAISDLESLPRAESRDSLESMATYVRERSR
ncbi:MAG: polyprenyl synthetase family protein [Chloroflexota bacterium]|nr:polyprenyl synthetase family protein [Chloroflexota bacterium]